jgi:hypothetical protein
MMTSHTPSLREQASGSRCEYLALSFSPLSAPFRSRWRNNGLSADFLGDYVMAFLPATGDTDDVWSKDSEIKHAVTYIANEFLENAMKYHERDADIPIGIRLELTKEKIVVSASNGVGAERARHYKAFLERILANDARDLLLRQLEQNSASSNANESGAGLLTIISDYGAQLSWLFEAHPRQAELLTVTTSAVLSLKSFPDGPA